MSKQKKKDKVPTRPFTVRLSLANIERLRLLAEESGHSTSALIIDAVREYLNRRSGDEVQSPLRVEKNPDNVLLDVLLTIGRPVTLRLMVELLKTIQTPSAVPIGDNPPKNDEM
jgi:hypothetical protein